MKSVTAVVRENVFWEAKLIGTSLPEVEIYLLCLNSAFGVMERGTFAPRGNNILHHLPILVRLNRRKISLDWSL